MTVRANLNIIIKNVQNDRMTGNLHAIEVQCESCGALISFQGDQFAMRCPFCDAPSVITRPAAQDRLRPVFALGFLVQREEAARAARRWISLQKMAPFGLKRSAPERITGVYLPAYLYSATARSQYFASIAEKYEKLAIENATGSS